MLIMKNGGHIGNDVIAKRSIDDFFLFLSKYNLFLQLYEGIKPKIRIGQFFLDSGPLRLTMPPDAENPRFLELNFVHLQFWKRKG